MSVKKNWITIFREGDYGAKGKYGRADLDKIVKNFNPAYHNPPLTIGHPKNDAPAHGWLSAAQRVGADLQVQVRDVSAGFKKLWQEKAFQKLSVAFYPDNGAGRSIRHLGALGAQPPEVKGLPQAEFADGDEGVDVFDVEFSDSAGVGYEEIFLEGGDEMDWKKIQEMIDAAIGGLKKEFAQFSEEISVKIAGAGKAGGGEVFSESEKKGLLERLDASEKQTSKLLDEIENGKLEMFCEGLVKETKLLPGEKTLTVGMLRALDNETREEFSEGDKKHQLTARERAMHILGQRKPMLETGQLPAATRKPGATEEFSEADATAMFAEGQEVFSEMGISKDLLKKHGANVAAALNRKKLGDDED